MTHGSLFTGIGGFDLASTWMGWDNVFHCEIEPFNQKILKYYWPKAISYGDIRQTDFTIHRGTIDVLTGGFPCQPYSLAGKREGKNDNRHLWPENYRAIREIQPRWVVGENVRGLTNWNGGLVFDEVQADLEAEGYEVLPFLLPACAVNAPHRRDRIWIIAFNAKFSANGNYNSTENSGIGIYMGGDGIQKAGRNESTDGFGPSGICRDATHANGDGQQRRNGEHEKHTSEGREYAQRDTQQGFGDGTNPNANSERLQGFPQEESQREGRWGARGKFKQFCIPSAWQNFPTQSPVCGGDDGIPCELDGTAVFNRVCKPKGARIFNKWRKESIKAYGNAIVPQVAYEIFKAIEAYEKQMVA